MILVQSGVLMASLDQPCKLRQARQARQQAIQQATQASTKHHTAHQTQHS